MRAPRGSCTLGRALGPGNHGAAHVVVFEVTVESPVAVPDDAVKPVDAADRVQVSGVERVGLGNGPSDHPAGAAVVSVPVLSKGRALKWSITPQSPGY